MKIDWNLFRKITQNFPKKLLAVKLDIFIVFFSILIIVESPLAMIEFNTEMLAPLDHKIFISNTQAVVVTLLSFLSKLNLHYYKVRKSTSALINLTYVTTVFFINK